MSGLENLRTRLTYQGGVTAESRFQKDKLKSLRKALLYSYQAETVILPDGRKFRCLINSDRTKADYDCKIISIPYEDICLGKVEYYIDPETGKTCRRDISKKPDGKTIHGFEPTNIKCGQVIEWEETNTFWLTYLERLEEDSYFRAEMYKCEEEIDINGTRYHIYIRGPVETTIQWNQKSQISWNDINYSLVIYITKDENTIDYFYRFKQVKIGGKTWEVKSVDPYSADGIIEVCLGEWYENTIEEHASYMQPKEEPIPPSESDIYIEGLDIVHPFDICEYEIHNLKDGEWKIESNKAIIKKIKGNKAVVEVVTGKSGEFDLIYGNNDKEVTLHVTIKSI